MNSMPAPAEVVPVGSYDAARFNALRHGVLSRYVVLPWEDEAEYRALLEALVAEHVPQGPTEEHLVEELAGIIWRKRRLRMAEAAVYRERLRHDATGYNEPGNIAGAALMPLTGNAKRSADIPQALTASSASTARDLRDVKRDQGMTQRAWNILGAGGADAYERAVAALRDDTRTYWLECLAQLSANGRTYTPTAKSLKSWIDHHWKEWYEDPIAELEHRDAIRDQAIGSAYASQRGEALARYEVHLDRKLERTLAMLVRLRELRRPVVPDRSVSQSDPALRKEAAGQDSGDRE